MSTPTDEARTDKCQRCGGKRHTVISDVTRQALGRFATREEAVSAFNAGLRGEPMYSMSFLGECPDCEAALTADEARELAKRWAWWHTFDKADHPQAEAAAEVDAWLESIGQAERVLHEPDRERLFAWVQTKVASIMRECGWAPGRRDDHIAARVYLSLWPHTIKAEGLANARALLDAAKAWPS